MPEPRLDEQVVSQAVQAGLSNQIDTAEVMNVDVRTDLLKAVQGQANSVTVSGEGVVVQDVRVQELEIRTDEVAIDPLSALLGNLKLNQPVNTTTRLVLMESDINRALQSDVIARWFPPLDLNVEGARVRVELLLPQLKIALPEVGKIRLDGAALLHEEKGTRRVNFATVILPRTETRPVLLEGFECQPGQALSLEFTIALLTRFKQLLSQPYLEFEGIAFRVKHLEIQPGSLTVETEAQLREIPTL
ncbi:MAG TPA: DUF2993 domain-containing protein [Thermosynechococcaceae cyanobacterium]